MSLHQGIDLSRFKRVASDGKTSTLRHSQGHEMKVAHQGLSPKMRQAVEGMPLHLADGTPKAPVTAPEASAAPMDATPTTAAPAAQATPDVPTPDVPTPDVPTPDANQVDVIGKRTPPTPQDLDAEAGKIAQDVELGHIEPKTMSSMYANKSTLGKIGTIFGLMVGGAGAGLSHQPNALLELMQKEIDNDLNAQKASKEGSRNWYQLNLQHEMNQAQMRRFGIENLKTKAEISKTPAEIAALKASAAHGEASAGEAAANASKTGMQVHILHDLQTGVVNKTPPGPRRDKEQATLHSLGQVVGNDIKDRNSKTSSKLNDMAAKAGEPTHAVDYAKLRGLMAAPAAGVPIPGLDRAMGEAADTEEGRELLRTYTGVFQKLNKDVGADKYNPADRDAMITPVVTRMVKHMTGSSDPKLVEEYKHTFFPDITDVGPARQHKLESGIEHFRGLEQRTPVLNALGLKTPFPYEGTPELESNPRGSIGGALSSVIGKSDKAVAKDVKSDVQKDEPFTTKSGRKAVKRDGKTYYLKDK